MAGRDPDPTEIEAADLVLGVLRGHRVSLDTKHGPDGMPDFLLTLDDGRRVALEVTRYADRGLLSMSKAAHGKCWPAPALANDWQVGLDIPRDGEVTNVKGLAKAVIPLLDALERLGVTNAIYPTEWPVSLRTSGAAGKIARITRQLAQLHVFVVRDWRSRQGDASELVFTIHGGVSPDITEVNQLALTEARANRAKLAAADADERHLFVWVDGSRAAAEFAMFMGELPSEGMSLPSGVDAVWTAIYEVLDLGRTGVRRLWRLHSGQWQSLELGAPLS
jgi:hypothetical protein